MFSGDDGIARLIAQCIAGDDAAKAHFYSMFAPFVQRAVLRKLSGVNANYAAYGEAPDICSEIFERIFADDCRALRRLNNPRSIHAWLLTVSQNHVITYLRRAANRPVSESRAVAEEPEPYVDGPDVPAAQNEEASLLAEGLAALSAQDRLILELFFLQGLKYSEISEIMGLNINTVAARIRRAKMKLRRVLEEDLDELSY